MPVNFTPALQLRFVDYRINKQPADTGAASTRQHEQVVEVTDRVSIPGMSVREEMDQSNQASVVSGGDPALDFMRRIHNPLPQ